MPRGGGGGVEGRGGWGGGGGAGGGLGRGAGGWQHTIPPNNPSAFSFNFYVKQEKNHKCTKLKGKMIINVTLI